MSSVKPYTSRKKIIRSAAVPGSLYGLLTGQLRFLNQHYEVIGVASEGAIMEIVAQREGIRTESINIERSISPIKDLISLFKLYRFFLKEKPMMVHSITPKAGLLSMVAAYFAKVPVRAHTFTGLIFPTQTGFLKKLLLLFDKIICAFATNVYPEGNGVKNDLIQYKVTKKPLKVIANGNVNGKDLTFFDPLLFPKESTKSEKNKLGITENDFVFIFIGRLVNDKGINELIHSFSQLSKKHSAIKLILVGSHEGETDVLPNSTWGLLNSEENIIWVGQQDDIRPYLSMANALVFPSYREGFPNVVLEAGAMGLPALVTDINGSNEIIVHGKNGYIVPSKDEQALLEAMTLFVEDSQLVSNMAQLARPMIANRYEQNFVWESLLNEYKRIEHKDS
ncbi:glycosyltransferase family 4 protein [Maribacter arcticus]|uniref:Glycosyltransferase involved in cell wall bisynthesis n=1 Tax=Maribacter arcticus TaxID=561365 RepID=A0A1T5BGU8_9FLAO|nr:glycosyltransferase family 4 protein [Maribacter arcticus]SKB46521.1 Glycosyltransferase involved in cell wall bisynthesis [Maribacter arcticus]